MKTSVTAPGAEDDREHPLAAQELQAVARARLDAGDVDDAAADRQREQSGPAITRNVAASAKQRDADSGAGGERSADQRADHEPDRPRRLDEAVRAADLPRAGEQRDERELRRLRDGDSGAEHECQREDRRQRVQRRRGRRRSPPGRRPTRSRAPASPLGRRARRHGRRAPRAGPTGRSAAPRRPAPCHSSFARSESAIIATQSPIDDTAIAPATRRRSRFARCGGHRRNLRLRPLGKTRPIRTHVREVQWPSRWRPTSL